MSDPQLVGSWLTRLDDDGRTVPGLVQFLADGGVVSTQLNTENIGVGSWRSTGPNTFEYVFHVLAADSEGTHVGEARVRVEAEFASEDAWQGTGGADFFDPAGARLRGHAGSKVTAERFGIPAAASAAPGSVGHEASA